MAKKCERGREGERLQPQKRKRSCQEDFYSFFSSRITLLPLLVAFPIFCESYFIRDEFTGEILTDVNYTAKEVGDQPT